MNLRIVTWNLWWRYGPWQARQKAILHTLRNVGPDICCLQEVWSDANTNLAQTIADDLDLHCAFYSTPAPGFYHRRVNDTSVGIGNAILSRWPIVQQKCEPLTAGDHENEDRLVGFAEIAMPSGLMPVFTTHLNSGLTDSAVRVAQVSQIALFMTRDGSAAIPPILAGDFNCEPDADEIRKIVGRSKPPVRGFGLRDSWRIASEETGATWSRRNAYVAATPQLPDSRIDYIFLGYPRESIDFDIKSAGLVGDAPVHDVWPSDHFGVFLSTVIRQAAHPK